MEPRPTIKRWHDIPAGPLHYCPTWTPVIDCTAPTHGTRYIIARKPARPSSHGNIVLAITAGYQPYVTWYETLGDPPSYSSGHYYAHVDDAAQDYATRD